MGKNRLDLNFSLEYANERKAFVDEYLREEQFKKNPLTSTEIETIANYILWGKDTDGKNSVQKKLFEIDTKHATWKKDKNLESLEGLMESPTFDENIIKSLAGVPTKEHKKTFNRKTALEKAPPIVRQVLVDLFAQIDETDLLICFYELRHGKRTNPPRQELIDRLPAATIEELRHSSESLTQKDYLKLRHLLVDLRTTQFTLQDTYVFPVQRETKHHITQDQMPLILDSDVPVFPLGLLDNSQIASLIFAVGRDVQITRFSQQDLDKISKFFWSQFKTKETSKFYFDFTNLDHVYQLLCCYDDVRADSEQLSTINSSLVFLLRTLDFYLELADLSDLHLDIYRLKLSKEKNDDIAAYINKKYNKSYTTNYISTIFKHQIIKAINMAAEQHQEIIANIFFPENFKRCARCGENLLRSSFYYVKKSRAADGFTGRCKRCDKEVRDERRQR